VLPTPTFSLAPGTYTTLQTVTISDATAGTTIYYTTNGTTPTTSSSVYSGAITVSATETLEAIAVKTAYTNSATASAAYAIAPVLPVPTFSLAPGTYTTSQTVTIGDATAGTTIYYTTNGTMPTTSSSVYSGAITVSATETLEAIAVKTAYTNSAVASAAYAIAPVLPVPTFSLAPGTYTTSQTVTIGDATAGTTIYYTTNGTMPTTSSSVYSGAITVSATETLEAIAVKTGYTNCAVASAAYVIVPETSYISYSSDGFTANSLSLNNGPTVTGGILQLTDGGTAEMRSAWSTTKVPVSGFTTDFTFQMLKAVADGMTFTIQNDPKGMWALGNGGSGLGYQGIQNSVALKFDIYNDAGEGTDSIGVYTDGAAPTMPATDLSSSGVTLLSGDLMHAHLVYSGTTLTVTLTDTKTGASVTNQFTVNIPSIVGGNTAYVGFTGSTGAFTAVQQITSWTYLVP
jgi:LysM repeat protein